MLGASKLATIQFRLITRFLFPLDTLLWVAVAPRATSAIDGVVSLGCAALKQHSRGKTWHQYTINTDCELLEG
jgi:hypothetical protein